MRNALADILLLAGIGCVVRGVALVSLPAGFVLGGVAAILLAILGTGKDA